MARLEVPGPVDSYCHNCRPELFPERLDKQNYPNEGRIAGRWGDISWVVTLDGVDVSKRCTEAIAGDSGKGVMYLEDGRHVFRCPCRQGGAEVVRQGMVQITREGFERGK